MDGSFASADPASHEAELSLWLLLKSSAWPFVLNVCLLLSSYTIEI
jgi:hypothetical protein